MSHDEALICEILINGPCCFCGYNGPNFYKAHTHRHNCPWFGVGGYVERIEYFKKALRERRVKVTYGVFDCEEFYKAYEEGE